MSSMHFAGSGRIPHLACANVLELLGTFSQLRFTTRPHQDQRKRYALNNALLKRPSRETASVNLAGSSTFKLPELERVPRDIDKLAHAKFMSWIALALDLIRYKTCLAGEAGS